MKKEIEELLEEMVSRQEQTLVQIGRNFVPYLTRDDALQPNDYPELEKNPYFRYEEGVLAGMHTVRAAILAIYADA